MVRFLTMHVSLIGAFHGLPGALMGGQVVFLSAMFGAGVVSVSSEAVLLVGYLLGVAHNERLAREEPFCAGQARRPVLPSRGASLFGPVRGDVEVVRQTGLRIAFGVAQLFVCEIFGSGEVGAADIGMGQVNTH